MKKLIFALGLLLLAPGYVLAAEGDGLANVLAKQHGISASQAEAQVDAVFQAVETELKSGHDVVIRKFGKFYLQQRQARQARNPKSGQKVDVPAKKYPRFSAAENLRQAVNKPTAQN